MPPPLRDPAIERRERHGTPDPSPWRAATPARPQRPPPSWSVSAAASDRVPWDGPAATPARRRREQSRSTPGAPGRRTRACRSRRSEAGAWSPLTSTFELLHLADDHVALDAAQTIHEQGSIEMIHLVLQCPRKQPRPFNRLVRSIAAESA